MSATSVLPHVTASLNALTTVLLLIAFFLIRAKNREAHKKVMLAAVAVSTLFLIFYLLYHFTQPIFVFRGQGPVRTFYYALLISHVILAMAVTPMVLVTLARGLKGKFDRHKGLARWTLPVWLYVSVSGIAVYVMLYHLYAPGA